MFDCKLYIAFGIKNEIKYKIGKINYCYEMSIIEIISKLPLKQ